MIAAAPIFLLGDVQLDYLPPEQRFTLMSGLQVIYRETNGFILTTL